VGFGYFSCHLSGATTLGTTTLGRMTSCHG
jgi:hypothetical protein